MHILLSTTALALVLALINPASAQMCGAGQAGASTAAGGMCGGMNMGQAPAATPDASKPQSSGMCGCCRNMAMMRGGQSGQGGGMNMPSMEMPKPQ